MISPRRKSLWALAILACLAVTAWNLATLNRRVQDYPTLARRALAESLEYLGSDAKEGRLDPQRKWWPVFWKMGRSHPDAEIRSRAKSLALTMLNNLGEHRQFLDLFDDLDPADPLVESLADQFLKACLGLGEGARYEAFARLRVKSHGEEALRRKWLIRLAEHLIDQGRHEEAAEALEAWNEMPQGGEMEERVRALRREARDLRPGRPAPFFETPTADGRQISSSALGPTPVALFFWSSHCVPSIIVRDSLVSGRPPGMRFISVFLGTAQERANLGWDAWADNVDAPAGFGDPLCKTFNVTGTPTLVLIDSSGRILGKFHSLLPMLERLKSGSETSMGRVSEVFWAEGPMSAASLRRRAGTSRFVFSTGGWHGKIFENGFFNQLWLGAGHFHDGV